MPSDEERIIRIEGKIDDVVETIATGMATKQDVIDCDVRTRAIEAGHAELGRCVVRLESAGALSKEHQQEVEKVLWKNGDTAIVPTIARIEAKIDNMNGDPPPLVSRDAITFKWLVEKILLPVVMPLLVGGGGIALVIRAIQSGAITLGP